MQCHHAMFVLLLHTRLVIWKNVERQTQGGETHQLDLKMNRNPIDVSILSSPMHSRKKCRFFFDYAKGALFKPTPKKLD